MKGFIESIRPFIGRYAVELVIIGIAAVIALFSLGSIVRSSADQPTEDIVISTAKQSSGGKAISSARIHVDVSGAVQKPGVYRFSSGARLTEAIKAAGGISAEADHAYFARNFNLARTLTDEEKIYVPSLFEIQTNAFITSVTPQIDGTDQEGAESVNINTAGAEVLDTLPGIGPVTAQKIIDFRPYSSPEELVSRKVVGQSVFNKIMGLISVEE